MITYTIDKGKTFFSQDFSQILCSFSYKSDEEDAVRPECFGMFVADVDWKGYFTDPILARYQQVGNGESWLESLDPDPVVFNDIFYNKLVEYTKLSKGKFGMAIEIDDEDFNEIDSDENLGDLFTEDEEIAIFNEMFSTTEFIEAFKNELDNPAKYNLLSAIAYFQKNAPIVATESIIPNIKFKKFL